MSNTYKQSDPEADFSKFFDKKKSSTPPNPIQGKTSKIKRKYYIYAIVIVVLIIIQVALYYYTQPPKPVAVPTTKTQTTPVSN